MRTQYYFNDILTKKCTTKSNHEKLSDKARNNYSIKKKKKEQPVVFKNALKGKERLNWVYFL